MSVPVYDKEQKMWLLPDCDFGTEAHTAIIRFTNSVNVTLATIFADGTPIGVCALSTKEKETTSCCEIETTSGKHRVEIRTEGDAKLIDVSFPEQPPVSPSYVPVPEKNLRDTQSDTWEATDMLGRKVASVGDVGAKRNRKVGIFYWTWHEAHASLRPVDVVDTLAKYPAAEYRADHPAWGTHPFQCFWHEPFYGFYRDSDPYVIRHHMSLLANAGVDFLLFDCTNAALLWRIAYEPLFAEMRRMREDGVRTPQVAFMLNFGPAPSTAAMLRALYQDLYKPGLYSDLWFRLDGKPMIMAYPDALPAQGVCDKDTALLNEIRNFFTFRPGQPGYGTGPVTDTQWGWLEKFPQHKFVPRADGSCEMMTVGVAQNCNDERICTHFNDGKTYGRSFTYRDRFSKIDENSYKYGYNVQEQWDRVLDIGPDIAFITGWNEWIMGQFHEPWLKDNDSTQLAMVDQYDREHSRDIEMDKDGYLDTYYLQMVSNIRRFKGAVQRKPVSAPQTIRIRAGERQWKTVSPVYLNDKGTTIHRDWDGFGDHHYKNETGRNDIISAKVTRDADHLYFMVTCAAPITEPTEEGWMTLFLDTDRSKATGWEGFDFAINRLTPKRGKTSVERYLRTADADSFTWEKIGEADISVKGNLLQIAVPRALLGMTGTLDFEFKWSDNMQEKNIMDFYRNGDTAPIGRFNYLYRE